MIVFGRLCLGKSNKSQKEATETKKGSSWGSGLAGASPPVLISKWATTWMFLCWGTLVWGTGMPCKYVHHR